MSAPFWACLVAVLFAMAAPAAAKAAFSHAGPISPGGQNASEPRVAVAANGDAVIAWVRFDATSARCCHRVQSRFRSAARGTWSAVQNVSSPGRSAADPEVAIDPDGDAVFAWVSRDGTDECNGGGCDRVLARVRSARTGALSAVQTLSGTGRHAGAPDVDVDAGGDAVFAWKRQPTDGCCTRVETRARSAQGLGAVQTIAADGGSVPQVEVDRDGDALFVWQRFEATSGECCWQIRARGRSGRTGALSAVQTISPPGRSAVGAQLALTPSGRAVVAWRSLDRFGQDVGVEARSRSAAGVLTAIQQVSPPGQDLLLAPRVGVDSDGDALFSWVHLVGGELVLAARRLSDGTLGGVQAVQRRRGPIDAHGLAVDGNGNAVFVWEARDRSGAPCCRRLWSRSRSVDGSLGTTQHLSAQGRDPFAAAVSVDPTGGLDPRGADALVAWNRFASAGPDCCGRIQAAKQFACDRFASPLGSDARPGTRTAPFRTAGRLARSLAPGETGCLRAATYREHVTLRRGGAPGQPLTLRSYPGERAKLLGRLWVTDTADFVTISSLALDGRTAPACQPNTSCAILPSPTVNGDDVTFRRNDVTNGHTTICFVVGSHDYGRAKRTVIEQNRIHHCGRLPATNHDHGIYVEAANDVRIENNLIHDNADRGVQLYPDAQRTYVARNVIDGNGQGILFGARSAGNLAEGNLITNSRIRWNLESYNLVGAGNEARLNCLYASNTDPSYNQNGGVDPTIAVSVHDNVVADPRYRNRAAKDYRLADESACAGKGPG